MVTVYARNQLFKVNNKKNDAKRISGADMFSNWKLIQGLHSDIEQKILVIFLSVWIQLIFTCIYFKNYCQTVMYRGTPSTSAIVDLSEPILSQMTYEQSPP